MNFFCKFLIALGEKDLEVTLTEELTKVSSLIPELTKFSSIRGQKHATV